MTQKFTVSIIKEGKWYVAHAIEFGVASQGRTIPDAKKNIVEAVELYLEDLPKSDRLKTKPLITTLEAQF